MIEIRYGERYEMAELAGKSVAGAREQYKDEFGIPGKAQASLNGKGLRKKLEPETKLSDDDQLSFAEKSRKGLLFIGCILLALAISGGVFAYTQTTATVQLGVTKQADFVAVTALTGPTWDVFGSYRGRVTPGDLFTITCDPNWSGDMSAIVTLANTHELVEAYRVLVLKIEVQDSLDNMLGTGPEYLTLGKGEIDIDFPHGTNEPYTLTITDGFYITHKGGWTDGQEDPLILLQVLQRSAP